MKRELPHNLNHDRGYEHTEEEGADGAGKIHEVDRRFNCICDNELPLQNVSTCDYTRLYIFYNNANKS